MRASFRFVKFFVPVIGQILVPNHTTVLYSRCCLLRDVPGKLIGRVAKDPRFETLPCTHKGTYADDCIVERVTRVRHILVLISVKSMHRFNSSFSSSYNSRFHCSLQIDKYGFSDEVLLLARLHSAGCWY